MRHQQQRLALHDVDADGAQPRVADLASAIRGWSLSAWRARGADPARSGRRRCAPGHARERPPRRGWRGAPRRRHDPKPGVALHRPAARATAARRRPRARRGPAPRAPGAGPRPPRCQRPGVPRESRGGGAGRLPRTARAASPGDPPRDAARLHRRVRTGPSRRSRRGRRQPLQRPRPELPHVAGAEGQHQVARAAPSARPSPPRRRRRRDELAAASLPGTRRCRRWSALTPGIGRSPAA